MFANILFPINAEAFTYIVPGELESKIRRGSRVAAPFKKSHKTGVVTGFTAEPADKSKTLRSIQSLLDDEPLIPENILRLIRWVGQYYMSTTGLALKNAVPAAFFSGKTPGKPRITYSGDIGKQEAPELTPAQRRVLKEINRTDKGVFLLHGVTGSGKTEVYVNAIESLPPGRQAIVLVPEIAVTVQIIDRLRSCFGDRVVFFHSGLSAGERIRYWQKMRSGEAKVVIGVRSAVFAPFENAGLIIIDEEQEASYKQSDGLRYNARDVALARAKLEGMKIILGSATPSMEAFHAARKGKFRYLEIKNRVDHKSMPRIEIIDMTTEDKQTFSLSNKLITSLRENISAGYQSLIMLNRRGYSPFCICADCGHTYKCPACSITLIYHKDTRTLNCHYCGSYLKPGDLCPNCGGAKVKYLGTGTQRVEEELKALIPELAVRRMDRDTTRRKFSHYSIIKEMEDKKIDLLLGTQMVAKGHDFPDVTLSAIISADVTLNMPDFRSAERAFQLFTQLAGRSGRGDAPGKAYIQTYEAGHYVFDYVRNNDYKGFYEREMAQRKELSYPPSGKLLRIILSFRDRDAGEKAVAAVSERIKKIQHTPAGKDAEILGPAPAPIEKIRNFWRWHIILKGRNSRKLRERALAVLQSMKGSRGMKIDIDVDPVNLM
ncbi:MAG: primosomal protein N' [Deferribacteres bacterium]|nr:primosomal protein N' [Deferribacteres bacterium]